ncbi:hypothetical protein [Streptomyces sp. NPDC093225]|uniref:hypothetical protein n=1 Tax=Streptomyces sp. NPDC093225 TaxID=3366034 RepID=UPI003814E1F7
MSSAHEPELDPVRRMRVMAAALPLHCHAEAFLEAPFVDVWAVAGDPEGGLPRLLPGLRRLVLVDGPWPHQRARAHGPWGRVVEADVLRQPGWCLMQSERTFLGLAAVPQDHGTRFGFFAGPRTARNAAAGHVLERCADHYARRVVARLRASVADGRAGRPGLAGPDRKSDGTFRHPPGS